MRLDHGKNDYSFLVVLKTKQLESRQKRELFMISDSQAKLVYEKEANYKTYTLL